MNSENFTHWLQTQLIPNLPPNSVLVVDNASYHNTQDDKRPTTSNNKTDIKSWLDRNQVQYKNKMLKA